MDGPNPHVYFYSWEYSTIRSSFPAPGGLGAWGITRASSSSFFITNNRTSWIYETTRDGSILSSFRCPFDGPADLGIKSFNPSGLLVAIPDRNILALLDRTTGSLLGTYAGPGSRPMGYYGYAHMYVADAGTQTIYENYVPVITGIQEPVGFSGLAYTAPPYDIELFVIDDATDRYYYYYRSSETSVAPASLGRVKALFK